jgi:hypothetical protein
VREATLLAVLELMRSYRLLLDCRSTLDVVFNARGPGRIEFAIVSPRRIGLKRLRIPALADSNPLHVAVEHDSPPCARILVRATGDVNIPHTQLGKGKQTILHKAVSNYKKLGWHIPFFLAHSALKDLEDEDGNTPLLLAVAGHFLLTARVLLESGADVNACNNKKQTSLGIVMDKAGDLSIVHLLLLFGADVHASCDESPCALFSAVQKSNCAALVRTLLDEYDGNMDK